jgi:DNA helicase HerA-like ATPase
MGDGERNMQIVGTTTQMEAWAASRSRKFHINEILIIADADHGELQAEVVQTTSFNRYIPLANEQTGWIDADVLDNMRSLGFSLDDETVYLAKLRLLEEVSKPITVGSPVRVPIFSEVEKLLVKKRPAEGWTLGVILGTADVAKGMPDELQNVALLYDKEDGIVPQNGVPFIFDYRSMDNYPHIGIFGGSGSGKSFGLRVLLEELMKKKVPAIVFDPHYELQFREPFPGLPEDYQEDFRRRFIILAAGSDVGIEFSELTSDDVVSLLRSSSGTLTDAMENAIKTLHKKGDSYHSFASRVANMAEALDEEEAVKKQAKEAEFLDPVERERIRELAKLLKTYKDKIGGSAHTLRAITRRLNRLEMEGVFLSLGTHAIEEALMRRQLVVIRGSIWFLQVFASYLVRKLYQKRRAYRDSLQKGKPLEDKFPPFVIITDEAHNFAPTGGQESPTKAILKEIAQEGRKYGVFLVLATQRPALLDDTITAQLSTKIVFRTVRATDIQVIREETDLTAEEAGRLPYLPSGTAFLSSAITGRTVAIRIRVSKTTSPHASNPFAELDESFAEQDERLWQAITDLLPIDAFNLTAYLPELSRKIKRPLSHDELAHALQSFAEDGRLAAEKTPFGLRYKRCEKEGPR